MTLKILALSLLVAARAAAGPCLHDEYRKSLDAHCVQLAGDGQRLFNEANAAEKAQKLVLAKETFAGAFKTLRQAARLGARPGATAFSGAVVRLLLAKAGDASKRYAALCRLAGETEEALQKELEGLKQQADAEMQERLDCIAAAAE